MPTHDIEREGQADMRLANIATELHDLRVTLEHDVVGTLDRQNDILQQIARSLATIAEVVANR